MHGFLRVGTAVPVIKVANTDYNANKIINLIKQGENLDILVFPELCVTGSTCEGLFGQKQLINLAAGAVLKIMESTKDIDTVIILSAPLNIFNNLLNCRVIILRGKVVAVSPRADLNYEYLKYFKPLNIDREINFFGFATKLISNPVLEINNFTLGFDDRADIKVVMGQEKADVYSIGNNLEGQKAISRLNNSTIIYVSPGFGESTTRGVYSGQSFIVQDGRLCLYGSDFSLQDQIIFTDIDLGLQKLKPSQDAVKLSIGEKQRALKYKVRENPFLPSEGLDTFCESIIKIQVMALAKRVTHINCENLVIGVSGGLDSTIALLICCFTMKRLNKSPKQIYGITMPGFGTSNVTYSNAKKLMQLLGITNDEISIVDSCNQHFKDIGHENHNFDTVFENAQARERSQILFDIANKINGLVVGTGDFTESALGFSTYNGDHISNYNVNANLPKTVIKEVIRHMCSKNYFSSEINKILLDVVGTHISPELLPVSKSGEIAQKTEDIVGPYELNDFYLYYILRHGFPVGKILYLAENAFGGKYSRHQLETVLKSFYKRFAANQFKRNCQTDSPSIFDFSFSAGSFVMPSDADIIF
ncbi:MAG: NAD(+) synthase [Clostridiales bacterium]|jgi:NAD+ synthase (glutamine-hydrolysing)|nr:NAD(+) synthase [Clostridiales bacterium]